MLNFIRSMFVLMVVLLIFSPTSAASDTEVVYINGPGYTDVSIAPGKLVDKNGPGSAIVALKKGAYTIKMDGPGKMYLIGLDDYSSVHVESKNGEGVLVWIPKDEKQLSFGPEVGKVDGPGKIRMGTAAEVLEVRAKHLQSQISK